MDVRYNAYTADKILAKIKGVQALAVSNVSAHPTDDLFDVLLNGEMDLQGLMPWSSNYTFLADIQGKDGTTLLGVYKPGQGERPLWDFPDNTLSLREFTSYLISQVLGWPKIPPTILRDGPHGLGSVQLFIDADFEAHYFTLRDAGDNVEAFRQMALFDFIVNNADRKGGHCLKGKDGQIWAIDHGLTFHIESKLRTVIWEFCEDTIPDPLLENLIQLQNLLHKPELCQILSDLITPREIQAFKKRVASLVSHRHFPPARSGRNVPFPPV